MKISVDVCREGKYGPLHVYCIYECSCTYMQRLYDMLHTCIHVAFVIFLYKVY